MMIYLDESGNLTKGSGKYFIVGSYTVGDPKRIGNAFRKWQQRSFPKKLRYQSEVKFNDSHLTDKLRLKTIRYLAKQDIRIFYSYLNKKNIPARYRKDGQVYETGILYTEIVVTTLELYLPLTEPEFIINRDKRTLKGVSVAKFNEIIETSLLPKFPAKTTFHVNALDSTISPYIQIADWICGALARFYEQKPLGTELYERLKNNIVQEKELFSDHWTNIWKK